MRPLIRFLSPLRQLAAAFFSHDLALRRGDKGMEIVLEQRSRDAAAARAPTRAEAAARKQAAELARMLDELGALLAEIPEARQTLRHLDLVEQSLRRSGLGALDKVPLDVLQHALEQFEGLVTNWSPVGLAALRSKMAVAIIDREHMDPDAEADAYRTAAVLDTHPSIPGLPEVVVRTDDEALAAAYAALGHLAPAAPPLPVEMHGELGSRSARAIAPPLPRPTATAGEISLRELQT